MFRRTVVAILAAVSLTLGFTAASATAAPAAVETPAMAASVTPVPLEQYSPQVQRIVADTNAFRAQNGLPPVTLAHQLNVVAGSWTQHMHDSCTFAHNPSYSTQIPAGWTRAAENIAAGQQYTDVVNAWINSPGHRANLLGDFTHIGIGYVDGPNCYGRYFTQVFAKY